VAELASLFPQYHRGSGGQALPRRSNFAAPPRAVNDARRFGVSMIEVEPDFGQGMWVAASQPILTKIWKGGATVQESEWAKGQKEVRIIDTLEPVLTQHRMVVAESFLREDGDRGSRLRVPLTAHPHHPRSRRPGPR
jgi:hypothetical protein